jgi:hypothetical protein
MRRSVLTLVLFAPLAGACFQPRASSSGITSVAPPSTPIGPVGGGSPAKMDAAAPPGPGPAAADPCTMVRTDALRILKTNCAPCHQDPANQANFSFCLDVDKLAMATSSTGKKFLVPGSPEMSRVFERVANNEMPPAAITQRPSKDDVNLLRQWITSCAQVGAGGFGKLDAGMAPDVAPEPDPGPGCGKSRQPCCEANTCEAGGCCVFGFCRGNGQSCTGGPGGNDIPGMCMNGSCLNMGATCGSVHQACCGVIRSCTAAQAVCGADAPVCEACGKAGGACCKNGGRASCLDGLTCVGQSLTRDGSCQPCGGMAQACCGVGQIASRTCNAGLSCGLLDGVPTCQAPGAQQPDAAAPPPAADAAPPRADAGQRF